MDLSGHTVAPRPYRRIGVSDAVDTIQGKCQKSDTEARNVTQQRERDGTEVDRRPLRQHDRCKTRRRLTRWVMTVSMDYVYANGIPLRN
jgi:hypothetical protein